MSIELRDRKKKRKKMWMSRLRIFDRLLIFNRISKIDYNLFLELTTRVLDKNYVH
jgi:hypothetical protein